MTRTLLCRNCDTEFEAPIQKGQVPFYCDPCRPIVGRRKAAERMALARAADPERFRGYQRAHRERHPEAVKNSQLWTKYRITIEQYEWLLEQQGGVCAICLRAEPGPNTSWHVDHDHACCSGLRTCGRCIRGLLCGSCNALLVAGYERLPAQLRDSVLLNEYLDRHVEFDPMYQAGLKLGGGSAQ